MDPRKYYDKVGELGIKDSDFKRFDFVSNHLISGSSLVDVGCGCGEWLKYLSNLNFEVLYGCDISPIRLNDAKKTLDKRIYLSIDDINHLKYRDHSFDQSTALEVIEHIPEWMKGVEELLRITSKRTIITVPYNENLKYEICPKCNEKAFLYGHLHSFKENDFEYLILKNLEVKLEKIENPQDYSYYARRLLNFISRKTKPESKCSNGHSSTTICPNCYTEVSYTKYYERMRDRALRLLTNSPEYLLVEINK